MRMTAPAIGGAAIGLAVALAWYFRPPPESSFVPSAAEVPAPAEPVTDVPAPRIPDAGPAARAPAPAAASPEPSPEPSPERAPLPGETPAMPIAQLLAERQQNMIGRGGADGAFPPPELAEGEREFAAEPVDATWAPGAEADVLSKFAQMPGLKLIDLQVECRSTMCRVQFTQPSGAPEPGGARPFNILRNSIGLEPRWMMAVIDGSGAGALKSIAYLWRDGFAPARPAEPPRED